jgi:hypothetical protein
VVGDRVSWRGAGVGIGGRALVLYFSANHQLHLAIPWFLRFSTFEGHGGLGTEELSQTYGLSGAERFSWLLQHHSREIPWIGVGVSC